VLVDSDTAGTPEIFAAALQPRIAPSWWRAYHGAVLGFNDIRCQMARV